MNRHLPLVLLALVLAGCGGGSGEPEPVPPAKPANALHHVVYRAEGTAPGGTVSFWTAGGVGKEKDAALPWEKSFELKTGSPVSVSITARDAGTVSCSIAVDGKIVERSTGDGRSALATCDWRLGSSAVTR
ncbi:MmpS family transport accessory protein [Actinocorallia longicatena]|uniref:MmpS family membrane protein n=1 Tax=Actinocorallia longicatena TaxID=111803 RepID=A0ABP6Q6Z0_9ACTN